MTDLVLHPIAAALAASLQRSSDGATVSFPTAAVEIAVAALKKAPEALEHVVAVAAKIRRVSGEGGWPAIAAIAAIAVEVLGSQQAAADRFSAAGLKDDAAALLGNKGPLKAPTEQPKPSTAAPVKAKRGLSR